MWIDSKIHSRMETSPGAVALLAAAEELEAVTVERGSMTDEVSNVGSELESSLASLVTGRRPAVLLLVIGRTVVSSSQVVSAAKETDVVLNVGSGRVAEVIAEVPPEAEVAAVTLKLLVPKEEFVGMDWLAVRRPVEPFKTVEFGDGCGTELDAVPEVGRIVIEPDSPVVPAVANGAVVSKAEDGAGFVGCSVDSSVELERGNGAETAVSEQDELMLPVVTRDTVTLTLPDAPVVAVGAEVLVTGNGTELNGAPVLWVVPRPDEGEAFVDNGSQVDDVPSPLPVGAEMMEEFDNGKGGDVAPVARLFELLNPELRGITVPEAPVIAPVEFVTGNGGLEVALLSMVGTVPVGTMGCVHVELERGKLGDAVSVADHIPELWTLPHGDVPVAAPVMVVLKVGNGGNPETVVGAGRAVPDGVVGKVPLAFEDDVLPFVNGKGAELDRELGRGRPEDADMVVTGAPVEKAVLDNGLEIPAVVREPLPLDPGKMVELGKGKGTDDEDNCGSALD